MRNLLFGVLAVAAGYVLIGTLLDSVILPEDEPGPPFYPPPGSQFVSKTEGFRQTVLKRENRLVWVELELEPHAAGPPEHVHTSFAENFAVAEGTLSILFQGQRRVVRAGETLLVPAGHSAQAIQRDRLPCGRQRATGTRVRAARAVRGVSHASVWLLRRVTIEQSAAESAAANVALQSEVRRVARQPPVPAQKALFFIIRPAARLFGYRTHYEKYMPRR